MILGMDQHGIQVGIVLGTEVRMVDGTALGMAEDGDGIIIITTIPEEDGMATGDVLTIRTAITAVPAADRTHLLQEDIIHREDTTVPQVPAHALLRAEDTQVEEVAAYQPEKVPREDIRVAEPGLQLVPEEAATLVHVHLRDAMTVQLALVHLRVAMRMQ